ncbi:MAG: DNA gyrase inhibitor YacG [Hydrogenophaga sp.]|nr:DNA gyrase inhibitor YacG [Hydrogenophaga sp.]
MSSNEDDRGPDAAPLRTVRCPACGGPSVYGPSNPYRPFCRDRCKHLDLGAWASERFAMPQESPEDLPLMGSPDGQRLAD